MHILHIGKYFPPFCGGIENFMADLMLASANQGLRISALVHQHTGHWNNRLSYEQGNYGINLYRVSSYGQLLYAPISPTFGWHLAQLIKRTSPDVLHVHMPNTSAFWLLTPGVRRIPLVIHWHADVISDITESVLRGAYQLYRPFEQALLRRAQRVLVTSPDYLEHSIPLQPWRKKCEIVPLGLAEQRVTLDSQAGESGLWQSDHALKLLTIGRLTPYKGHRYLIDAVHQTPGVELIIVGDGKLRKKISEQIHLGAGADRIQVVSGLSDSMRNRLIIESDLLCLTSLNRAEAFGLAIVEAKALARPTLASNVEGSGMSWIVKHGKTGWKCPPGDSAAIAGWLRHAKQNKPELRNMGQAARDQFENQFRIEVVADQVREVYTAAISS